MTKQDFAKALATALTDGSLAIGDEMPSKTSGKPNRFVGGNVVIEGKPYRVSINATRLG